MPSVSRTQWFGARASALNDIESAHRSLRGTGPGARAAAMQVYQAYAVLLSSQFQAFCRDLHFECSEYLATATLPTPLGDIMRGNLVFNRKLDRGNPNAGNIGSDFNRFGLVFWTIVDAHHPQNHQRKSLLEELNGWRNAIAHHDFTPAMAPGGRLLLTLALVQNWRRACDGLARSFDGVMRSHIISLTGVPPW